MKFPLIIEPSAESDLRAAFGWYENQVLGLGHEFPVLIRTCFSRLERTPEIYPPILGKLRRARIDRFPFGVFYIVSNETSYVLGVMHHSKNPEAWMKRIKIWGRAGGS